MNTRCQNNGSSNCNFFGPRSEISDYHHLTIVACNGFTQYCFSYFVFRFWHANFGEILTAVTVSVRVTVRKEDLIFIILKSYSECQSEIEPASLFLHAILVVTNVIALSEPSYARLLIGFSFRVYQWLHALIVGTFWLDQVYDVEFIRDAFSSVAHFEEEPLSVVASSIVILKHQIVLIFTNLNSTSQIS